MLTLTMVLAGAAGALAAKSHARRAGKTLTTVLLATLPVEDTVPAVIAQKEGFFRQEGLNVELKLEQLGTATTSAIVTGAAQFSQSNYATLLDARSRGIPVEIVCEATRGLPQFSSVLVLPNSPITSPKDLAGKRIATPALGSIGPLAVDVWLKDHGVDYRTIKWVQMPFQNMGAALEEHQVDAAWVGEPFVTILTETLHARPVFQGFSGPTANLPVAAFATSEPYAKAHPAIVDAFKAAIEKAEAVAARDPSLVRRMLTTYTTISPKLAARIGLEEYPTSTSVAAIERVAEFMREVGFLTAPVDVPAMVWQGR
jgi:NitT/TauT family transport system substrate-binding protein